jgi:hypothetical protein
MRIQKKTSNYLLPFLLILLAITLFTVFISINKGFDYTDEGGFLLSYKNTDIYRGGIYNYHIIINNLTEWMNPGIIEYRFMSIILVLLSSLISSLGLKKWIDAKFNIKNNFSNFLLIFSFISLGNLIMISSLVTIYNNILTNVILQISTGFVLYISSFDANQLIKTKKNLFILLSIGFICIFSFFIKFSTGFLQLNSYILFFFIIYYKSETKFKLIILNYILIGSLIGLFVYFTFFQNYNEWLINYKYEYSMLSDHSVFTLLKRYYHNILYLITFLFKNFSWLLIFFLINNYYQIYSESLRIRYFINFVLILSIAFFFYEIYHFNFHRWLFNDLSGEYKNAYFYIIIISFQILLLLSLLLNTKKKLNFTTDLNLNKVLVVLLLILTPFFGALGTANPIFLNVLCHSATWFSVILILTIQHVKYIKIKVLSGIFISITSVVTTSQIIDGFVYYPYHSVFNLNKSNFFNQNEQIKELPLLDDIYVDIKSKTFLLKLNQILKENNYKKGYPIFGFHIPGVVYLFEGISPGVPYYYNTKRDNKGFENFKLINNPPIILDNDKNPINIELLEVMKTKKVNFPTDYILKGKVYFPNNESILKIYFPKNYNLNKQK